MNWKPKIRLHDDGRISFPGAVRYRVRGGAGATVTALPPTHASHPAPPTPSRMPSSLPFRIEVLDLAEYIRLGKTGWLYDPRHTGHSRRGPVDNRSAPGA